MDRWRSYFGKAGADIWTTIDQAILLAAIDYPNDFKEKRSEIAETLFARSLLQLHSVDTDATRLSGSMVTNGTNLIQEHEFKNDREGTCVVGDVERYEEERLRSHDEAEVLVDEEEETHLLQEIFRIKEAIAENDQSETSLLELLQRLEYMQISVKALKVTEIGKQVNSIRKHSSKRVRAIVKRLVGIWKDLVDEWVKHAGDVTAAAAGSSGDIPEAGDEELGLASPPNDEGVLVRTTSSEVSQLLSFMDDEICGQTVETSIEDNLYYPFKSHSGSIMTDSSDCDGKASTSYNWGIRAPEERGSATRDAGRVERKLELKPKGSMSQGASGYDLLDNLGPKSVIGGSGPGRPSSGTSKVSNPSGPVIGRPSYDTSKTNNQRTGLDSSSFDKSSKPSTLNKSAFTDKSQVPQRLEIAKRKLHEGYQQAENAKKQRTVQIVDLPDLPKAAQMRPKVNPPVQSKAALKSAQWSQNRRYG